MKTIQKLIGWTYANFKQASIVNTEKKQKMYTFYEMKNDL